MTTADFLSLISSPENVQVHHSQDLKELTEKYPYFYQARLLWLRSLRKSESLHFDSEIQQTALYAADKRWMYFYLYPEKKLNKEDFVREEKSSGSYFDLLDAAEAEGGDPQLSLKMIAERLKASRAMLASESKVVIIMDEKPIKPVVADLSKPVVPVIDYFHYEEPSTPILSEGNLEEKSKQLIKDKRYLEAIEILNELNLINPKKSIYFADQIRFLEKIIANSK